MSGREDERPDDRGPRMAQVQRDEEGSRYPTVDVGYDKTILSNLDVDLNAIDKRFKYKWVNVAPLKVSRARQKGFAFVAPEDLPAEVRDQFGDALESGDGRLKIMDVILMRMPRDVHQGNRQRVRERTKARLGAPKRKFKKDAQTQVRSRYGVSAEVITDKEPAGSKE